MANVEKLKGQEKTSLRNNQRVNEPHIKAAENLQVDKHSREHHHHHR